MPEEIKNDDILEAFFAQSGPEKVGKGYIEGKWKSIFLLALLLPYLLLLFNSTTLNWVLLAYGVLVIIITVLFISVFKEAMMHEINPFDFVFFQFSIFGLAVLQFSFLFYIFYLNDTSNYRGNIEELNIIDFIYYSVVTVSTLGYGDIVPISKAVKLTVVAELIYGMWFLVTIIPIAVSLQAERMAHLALKRTELNNKIKQGIKDGTLKFEGSFETKKGVGIVKRSGNLPFDDELNK